jgi:integrase/recombinase XerD
MDGAMRMYDAKLNEFLTSLQLERGASPHTIEAYRRDLIDLGMFIEHADPDTVDVSVLDEYAVALRDRGLSPATVRRRLAAVRAFLKHRAREGGRPDAGRGVPLPRLGRRLPEPLTPEEADRIVTQPDGSPRGLRDRAMLELMYGAGLRVSELVALRVSDVDLEEGLVRCMGKGARQRIVPTGGRAIDAIRVYMQRGRPHLGRMQRGDILFLNHRGQGITRQAVFQLVREHARAAGVQRM